MNIPAGQKNLSHTKICPLILIDHVLFKNILWSFLDHLVLYCASTALCVQSHQLALILSILL